MTRRPNLLVCTDAYKGSHFKLFPPEADACRYYLAPRKPLFYPRVTATETQTGDLDTGNFAERELEFITFGFTGFVRDYLTDPVTLDQVTEAAEIWNAFNVAGASYPFPFEAYRRIVTEKAGRLPVNIYGLEEGAVRNRYNRPVAIVECLEKDFMFLPGMLETALQRDIWYGSTVATLSRNVRVFLEELYETCVEADDFWTLDYRLHDFGARGVSSRLGAENGGLAHLINFKGTDTMEAILRGRELYGMKPAELASSIPAAEHSTVTSWGKGLEAEKASLKNMIRAYGAGAMFAFVSDSYDYKRFVDEGWGDPEIIRMIRERGAIPVVRPDSGDPVEMVLYALKSLSQSWGFRENQKGYKILDGIAVIQGDGMDLEKIKTLYRAVVAAGYSPQNVAVGMGGGLLQRVNRDSMSWSMKMYQIRINGRWVDVQKDPLTQKDKIGWNPTDGLDTRDWVTYYKGDPRNASLGDLPDAQADFNAIRERARKKAPVREFASL